MSQLRQFHTPFTRAYWRAAAQELRKPQALALAALLIALRVVLKSVVIPVGESLYIYMGFLPNALSGMLFGPVVALISGAISDILGAVLFPQGPFFPPFTLVEMLGSLLFALFLYRAPLSVWRAALAKLSVNLLCNITLTPILLSWMYGKAIRVYLIPRIAKNLLLFPLEAALLYTFLRVLLPALSRFGLLPKGQPAPKLTARDFILFAVFALLGAVAVALYYARFAG